MKNENCSNLNNVEDQCFTVKYDGPKKVWFYICSFGLLFAVYTLTVIYLFSSLFNYITVLQNEITDLQNTVYDLQILDREILRFMKDQGGHTVNDDFFVNDVLSNGMESLSANEVRPEDGADKSKKHVVYDWELFRASNSAPLSSRRKRDVIDYESSSNKYDTSTENTRNNGKASWTSRQSQELTEEDQNETESFQNDHHQTSHLSRGRQLTSYSSDTSDEANIRKAMHWYRQRSVARLEDGRMPRLGHMRPLPAAHYDGDTSDYNMNQHPHYNGNGHLRHLSRSYVDWKASPWVADLEMDNYFKMNEGTVKIRDSGLYLVYAQIYYLDVHDVNAYRVYKNGETLLQCTVTTHSVEDNYKGNTCFTAGVTHLVEDDEVNIGDLGDGRYSLFEEGKSFFGLVKLGDIKK